ncbi:hypothetical protein [Metabacillus fastidiosus]|uniref:hypothetical protein n=1 Tax=Metabacillus fastidiosus TaxID=1458 RepID=UPI002E1AA22E|nr:hypothetical protein [Metabacillus fastidiosus]
MEMDSELLIQSLIVFVDLVLGLFIGFRLSNGKSKKRNIIWGLSIILAIAPLLSVLLSIIIAFIAGDGWTGIAIVVIILPLFFFVGLGRLLAGLFRGNGEKN